MVDVFTRVAEACPRCDVALVLAVAASKATDDALAAIVSSLGGDPPAVLRVVRPPRSPGLGDYVHAGLAAVGITPDRVAAALGVEDCGCEERRQALNQAGYVIGIGSPPTEAAG
jgi:hypothetical protein